MTRRYGWALEGERCVASAPCGHWKTSMFLARQEGWVAPRALEGPMDGVAFRVYVETFLCPTLKPGDIGIADLLGSHKVAGVREAIEAVGATLRCLPPYSPDLHPIERLSFQTRNLIAEGRTPNGGRAPDPY